MPSKKLTDATIPSLTRSVIASDDLLYIVDVSDTTDSSDGTSKSATCSSLPFADALTPQQFGAIADGTSHPLSERYGSLAAAQAVYPHATALTDEIDWAAWQAVSNYIYDRDDAINGGATNWSGGTIYAFGNYVLNKTVVFNHVGIRIVGDMSSSRAAFAGNTSIEYNGTAGTEDAPVYMFDFYTTTEDGSAPSGRNGNSTVSGSKVILEYITFTGNGGAITTEGSSNYISGVLLRRSNFPQIRNCNFGSGLYDGIVVRGPTLWMTVEQCNFYQCNRDCIGVWAVNGQSGTFSTTVWIRDNEFGYYGRYAILMDLSGSVEPMPIISNNSIEGSAPTSFFWQNPEWFVHGVIASLCYINCGNLVDEDNRFEGTAQSAGLWGDYHLIDCNFATISKSTGTNIVLSTKSNAQARSDAAITFATANLYLDITDQRNYRLGTVGDLGSQIQNLTLKKIYNLGSIVSVGDNCLSTSGYHNFEDIGFIPYVVPTKSAVAREGLVIEETASAAPLAYDFPALSVMRNVDVFPVFSALNYFGGASLGGGVGTVRAIGVTTAGIADWAATTAYTTTFDAAWHGTNKKMFVQPTTNNGYIYQCTTAGTSGGSEPTWPTTIGGTVADGTAVWTCYQRVYYDSENLTYEEYIAGGKRQKTGTAAPTAGIWAAGDKVINTSPSAGGAIGWVCTTAGEPGTWKTFGSIAA